MKIEQSTYQTIDPGLYKGKITVIAEDEGQFGPQLKYKIELEGGVELTTWSSQSFNPKSKLYKWALATRGGQPIPEGMVLDTDSMIGKPILVNVILKHTDTGDFNRVADLLPLPSQKAAAPKATKMTQPPTINRPADTAMPEEPPEIPLEELVAPA